MKNKFTLFIVIIFLSLLNTSLYSHEHIDSDSSNESKAVYHLSFNTQRDFKKFLSEEYDIDIWHIDRSKKSITALINNNIIEGVFSAFKSRTKSWSNPRISLDLIRTQKYRRDTSKYHVKSKSLKNRHETQATINGYSCYRKLHKTYADLYELEKNYSDLIEIKTIGESWKEENAGNGDKIIVVKITNRKVEKQKPILFVDAAIHPRELVTTELATRFSEKLVKDYFRDSSVKKLLDNKEVHIVPILNPDGRRIAETRKYKRKNENANFCSYSLLRRGVDLNRNFATERWEFARGRAGSTSVCHDTFKGTEPLSEPESLALSRYLTDIFTSTGPMNRSGNSIYISLHSYSELILLPDSKINSKNKKNFEKTKKLALKLSKFNNYKVCRPSECLYRAHGSSADWVFEKFKVPSLTYELGTDFFQDCKSFERELAPRNISSLIEALRAL